MNIIGRLISEVSRRYPQHLPQLMKELNTRVRTKVDDVKLLPRKVSEMTTKDPSKKAIILSVVGGVIGNQALDAIVSYLESTGGDGVFNPSAPTELEMKDLRDSLDAVRQLVNRNAGDGAGGSVWGVPAEEVNKQFKDNMTAFALIAEVSPMFGGVKGMEMAYHAFHALEPEHFSMFQEQRKIFRG